MNLLLSFDISDMFDKLWKSTGIYQSNNWQNYVMIGLALILFFLAIVKNFEPLLLVPIAFGIMIANIPGAYAVLFDADTGLLGFLSLGVEKVIFPPLIFLGIGAMTDFGPLIANPKSFLIGAAAQLGVFLTFFAAAAIYGDGAIAGAIAIIGGADGPTAIYVAQLLASDLVSVITVAAYSYMALIPFIQPIFMKLLTTKKERLIKMEQLRPVSKREKIIFPIAVTLICGLLLPAALPLLGMLMLGNLLKECMVTDRLAKTASNSLINIVTIILGVCVGAKAVGTSFLQWDSLKIVLLGLAAFCFGTCGGILMVKFMNLFSKKKMNPLIGSAGVSAVPMAARVSHNMGRKYDPDNYLLMHAMGPNVAGVIGSAVAAGILIALFG